MALFFHVIIFLQQWQGQWEDILKNAEDRVQTANINASALECLEGIHIFVLVNILRRPIIVLSETVLNDFQGQAIGYNHLGGVYLPLLWKPADCVRTPIVLAYHCNHFVPMLSIMDPIDVVIATDTGKHGVPLVSNDLQQLPLHFLREDEERGSANLLTLYLDVFETNMRIKGDLVPMLYAKFHFHDIDRELNMLDEYMDSLDHAFMLQQGADRTNLIPGLTDFPGDGPLEPTAPNASMISEISRMSIHTVPQPAPPVDPLPTQPPRAADRTGITENPFVFPQTGTSSYPPRQLTNTPSQTRGNVTATYPPTRPSPVYRDVSISGEECRSPNCSFYSSLETYPYCHECYAKLVKMRRSQQLPAVREEERGSHQREGRPTSRSSSSAGLNDEVFGDLSFTCRTPDRIDRQRSLSYEEEEGNNLLHRRDDEQPMSIPYTVNKMSCSHPDCPKRGKGICEGRCHEHYRTIGSQELRNLYIGGTRPRTRSHLDNLSPKRGNEREGRRGTGVQTEVPNRMTSSAVETRRTGTGSPGAIRSNRTADPGVGSMENTNTPTFAATFPPLPQTTNIGQSVGRIPGNIMEPTSMRPQVPCKNTKCTNPGYEYTEGFCQTCFNAISIAKAAMARTPRQEQLSMCFIAVSHEMIRKFLSF
jgi:hypothetical protein